MTAGGRGFEWGEFDKNLYMADSTSHGISSAKAVLYGALAPGVNGPTWVVLRITLMMLTICLMAMLSLAFVSRDFIIVSHVIFLIVIGAVLFVLLNGFLGQTGLISVEQQMEEMGIFQKDGNSRDKQN